jgi:hypothetical protein
MFSNIQYFQLLLLKTFAEIPDYFLNGEAEVPNSSLFMQTCWETLNFNYLLCIPVIPCFKNAAGRSVEQGLNVCLLIPRVLSALNSLTWYYSCPHFSPEHETRL